MYEDEGSDSGPRGTFEIYRAEGDSLYKNGEYRKSIESYNTALEMRDDRDCLVARSRCYLHLGDTEAALRDAETSLKEDPDFHKGLFQKAEALYCRGEFELALVFYHRGHKLRPELQEFRLGIQKSQEAIDNSVGSPERVKLTTEGDLSFFSAQTDATAKAKAKPKSYGSYNRPGTRNDRHRLKAPPKSATEDKSVKQLLGELYGDRVYLEKLLKETDTQTEMGRNIYNLVCDGLHYLDTRTEFWRQQKPMYARRSDRQTKRRVKGETAPNQFVIKELEKIDEEQTDGKFEESLRRAKKCLRTVDGYADGVITNREEVVANLHSCMGNALLEMGQFERALNSHTKDLEIGKQHDIDEATSRALDNIGRVYARQGEYQLAIDSWSKKLPMAKSPLESTWLYHEIGRCYLEMGRLDEAKDYGEKSNAAAVEAGDDMWQLNATVLMAQAEVKLNELQPALGSFEKALDMAHLQGDHAAENAIKKAIEDVNSKIVKGIKESGEEGEETAEPEKGKSPSPEPPKETSPSPEAKNPRSPSPKPRSPSPEVQPRSPSPVVKPRSPSPEVKPRSPSPETPPEEDAEPDDKVPEEKDDVDGDAAEGDSNTQSQS